MAAGDEEGSFPSIDEVLNELKRNGTFDKFRKSCLASVQAEVSKKTSFFSLYLSFFFFCGKARSLLRISKFAFHSFNSRPLELMESI